LIKLTVCVIGSAQTAECVDRLTGEYVVKSYGELVSRRFMSYNMLISNSHLQSVQLGAWYCFPRGHCLICLVLVMLSNIGYEHQPLY